MKTEKIPERSRSVLGRFYCSTKNRDFLFKITSSSGLCQCVGIRCVSFTFVQPYQDRNSATLHLLYALRYKPEGRGFDSRWCHWNFSLTQSFRPHCGPGLDSASNSNEYQEYFLEGKVGRCVGLTTLPLSCDDCLEIWEPHPPGTLSACPGL